MQNPWLFYILSTNKNTYIRHFHSIAVVQVLHFAHSHGEKQKRDFILHCKYLHEQLLSWQTVLPALITDKKNLPVICPLPFHSQTVYISWMMILVYVFIYLMQKFIEAHPVFAAKAWTEKWKLKKKMHTHTQKWKRWTLSSNEPHVLRMVKLWWKMH